jgi:hypothetical protein
MDPKTAVISFPRDTKASAELIKKAPTISAANATPITQSTPVREAGPSLTPSAAAEASSTRFSVDKLILDYLLWYCTSALLIERCLRVEGRSNNSEYAYAARNGDNAIKLVNSSCVHAFCFY